MGGWGRAKDEEVIMDDVGGGGSSYCCQQRWDLSRCCRGQDRNVDKIQEANRDE